MKVLEPELACPPVVPGDRSGAAVMQSGTRVRILHEEDYLPFPLSNRDFVMAMRHPDPSGPAGSDGSADSAASHSSAGSTGSAAGSECRTGSTSSVGTGDIPPPIRPMNHVVVLNRLLAIL